MKKRKLLVIGCILVAMALSACGQKTTEKAKETQPAVQVKEVQEADEKKLTALAASVDRLYIDDTYAALAKDFKQEALDQAKQSLKEAKAEKNLTKQQDDLITEAEKNITAAENMFSVVTSVDSLYTDGVVSVKSDATDSVIADTKSKLEALKIKTAFCEEYNTKISDVETQVNYMESVKTAVFSVWNVEAGVMYEGVTRQQYTDVKAAVEAVSNAELKNDLLAMVSAVDAALTAQETEAARTAQAVSSSRNNSQSGSGTSTNSGGSSSSSSSDSSGGSSSSNGGGSSSSSSSSQDTSSGASSSGGSSQDSSGGSSGGQSSSGEYMGDIEGGEIYGGDLSEDWFE